MNRRILVLLLAGLFAFFFELGRMDIVADNEGQRTVPPFEMLQSGDFIVPTLNGDIYLAKPPLLYWAVAGIYAVTGSVDESYARIPTALAGLALVLCVFLLFRKDAGTGPAFWAAAALLTSHYFLQRSRWCELDVPLALAIFLAIMAYRKSYTSVHARRRWAHTGLCGLALGAAFLLKGPAALPFVWAAWIAMTLCTHEDRGALRTALMVSGLAFAIKTALWLADDPVDFPLPLGLALAGWTGAALYAGGKTALTRFGHLTAAVAIGGLIAAPWALAVLYQMGWPYIQGLLFLQVYERTYTASDINSGSPFFYLLSLPLLLAPWGLLFPLNASRTLYRRQLPIYRFALITGWLSVLIFSIIAGKENEYVMPAYPFLLLPVGFLVAGMAETRIPGWVTRARTYWLATTRGLAVLVALAAPAYIVWDAAPWLLVLEVFAASLIAMLALYMSRGEPQRRLRGAAAALLVLAIAGLTVRSFHYTGDNSFRPMSALTAAMLEQGQAVEVRRVYPALTHYAQMPIPVQTDVIKAIEQLGGETPYYLILRDKELPELLDRGLDPRIKILAGPWSNKDLIMIGNAPLPGNLPVSEDPDA